MSDLASGILNFEDIIITKDDNFSSVEAKFSSYQIETDIISTESSNINIKHIHLYDCFGSVMFYFGSDSKLTMIDFVPVDIDKDDIMDCLVDFLYSHDCTPLEGITNGYSYEFDDGVINVYQDMRGGGYTSLVIAYPDN